MKKYIRISRFAHIKHLRLRAAQNYEYRLKTKLCFRLHCNIRSKQSKFIELIEVTVWTRHSQAITQKGLPN